MKVTDLSIDELKQLIREAVEENLEKFYLIRITDWN